MKFILRTLVDITESGQRRGPDRLAVGQQSNYDTLIQVIGLRANPQPMYVEHLQGSLSNLGFGSAYKGKQSYWSFTFEVPDSSMTVEDLKADFDLVPYVNDLTETVNNSINVFTTQDLQYTNVTFEEIR